jgi:hypothetical protein
MEKLFMGGHCHVYALALQTLHPDWVMYAHIGWEEDAEDDSDYRIDHVFMVDPATGKAYDVRGEFADTRALIGNWSGPVDETQIMPYTVEDMKADMERGELLALA